MDLKQTELTGSLSEKISFVFARKHGVILMEDSENPLFKFREKISLALLNELQRTSGVNLNLDVINKDEFDKLLQKKYSDQAHGSVQAMDSLDNFDLDKVAEELGEPTELLEYTDDAPIIKLLNALITEAVRENASDIHIEEYENRLRIRFRIDGELKEVLNPDRKFAPFIVSRVKVMAKLDIAEKRVPQDGRISAYIGGKPVDIRVSTIPAGSSKERVVLRLLNKEAGRITLDKLGMPNDMQLLIKKVITRPHGIFLVTGPTGSGKTTTLYAMLSFLNNKERNIMSIEDPVEYYIDGINQTQTKENIGMTFAKGLRSILRQDPDVIMVGEIRDLDTAEVSVQASLTGHMVFSTLHTNTAVGAVTRLRDMGVEPYLLASSLTAVLAQRLVRVLCDRCKVEKSADSLERNLLGVEADKKIKIYEAKGCPECQYKGYKGRTGVFELFVVDRNLEQLIHKGTSEAGILEAVRQKHSSLFAMGAELVIQGLTSMEEIMRVASQEES